MVRRPKRLGLRTLIALATVFIVAVGSAFAHEQKSVLTTIQINPRTEMLEVVHRVSLHDVEHAARALGWSVSDILQSQAVQAQFGEMVASQFSVATDQELSASLIGQELDGRYLWVYQEAKAPASMMPLVISSTVLRRLWPQHQHLVNVTVDGVVRSVTFANGITQHTLTDQQSHQRAGDPDLSQ